MHLIRNPHCGEILDNPVFSSPHRDLRYFCTLTTSGMSPNRYLEILKAALLTSESVPRFFNSIFTLPYLKHRTPNIPRRVAPSADPHRRHDLSIRISTIHSSNHSRLPCPLVYHSYPQYLGYRNPESANTRRHTVGGKRYYHILCMRKL